MTQRRIQDEDFDLYALGALEGEEKNAVKEVVRMSPEAARKLEEARGRMALLALAAPSTEPSAGVKERLLGQVHATAQGRAQVNAMEEPRKSFFRENWWATILTPAAAALALVTIFLWVANKKLEHQLEAMHVSLRQQWSESEQARKLLVNALTAAPDTITVSLGSQPGQPTASAKVMFNARQGIVIYDGNLPAPPPDKTYQLWLVPASGAPISAGVFSPLPGGKSYSMISNVPTGMTAKAFAVTLEPAGGRSQPTGPKVLVGAVS